jgi:hypothetical protein
MAELKIPPQWINGWTHLMAHHLEVKKSSGLIYRYFV